MKATPMCPRCGSTNVSSHGHPPPLGQANPYDPVYEEGYRCRDCTFLESHWNNEDGYEDFKRRWNDWREFSFEELKESVERTNRIVEQQEREWTWPDEDGVTDRRTRAQALADGTKSFPRDPALLAKIVQQPDDMSARREFARWLRRYGDARAALYSISAAEVADFIETQLKLAEARTVGERDEILKQAAPGAFANQTLSNWWRYPRGGRGLADLSTEYGLNEIVTGENLAALRWEGLIDDLRWYRGFVEHVAIKAHRFLEIADELYSLAPIRYLTITYAKGLDHKDEGLWRALMESPHLERIRSLRLPVSVLKNQYTELNRLTDADMELLAASPRLRGLRHLDLEDERHLTIRAFDALARSKTLVELSAIQFDMYYYEYAGAFTFGNFGPRTRTLLRRPLSLYAKELEERHGHLVWLHPVDYYGSEDPDPELVVEHPAALLARRREPSVNR